MAGRGTPATALLTRRKVAHTLHEYEHDPRHDSYGLEAARALGVPAARVFKTLLATVDGGLRADVLSAAGAQNLVVAIVPVVAQLDLKALAAAVGGKRATMAEVAVAERATGYVAGGISPLGQRKRLPTVIDASAREFDTVFCSAGRRGLEMELAPNDLATLLDAKVAPIAAN